MSKIIPVETNNSWFYHNLFNEKTKQNMGNFRYFIFHAVFTCYSYFCIQIFSILKSEVILFAAGRKWACDAYNPGLAMGSLAFAFINPACLDVAGFAIAAGIITEFRAEKSAVRVAPGKTKRLARTQRASVKLFLAPAPSAQNYTRRHAQCGFGCVKFVSRQGDAHLIQKWTKGITPNAARHGWKSCFHRTTHTCMFIDPRFGLSGNAPWWNITRM